MNHLVAKEKKLKKKIMKIKQQDFATSKRSTHRSSSVFNLSQSQIKPPRELTNPVDLVQKMIQADPEKAR